MTIMSPGQAAQPKPFHQTTDGRRAIVSGAATIVAGCLYLVIAPQPDLTNKLGSTRSSAVPAQTAHTNSPADSAVKIIGAQAESARPCDEQTWPYIDQRCLTIADSKSQPAGSMATPLGLSDMLAGVWFSDARRSAPTIAAQRDDVKEANREQAAPSAGGVTAIVSAPPVRELAASTVVAARDNIAASDMALADSDDTMTARAIDAGVPIPQPRPDVSEMNSAHWDDDAFVAPPPVLSRSEQRRWQREPRRSERAERRAANIGRDIERFFRSFR